MLKEQEVEHIAKLARIKLKKEEIKKFQKELSSILDYIKLLEEVDVSDIEPTFHSNEHYFKCRSIMREDKAQAQGANLFISLFPDRKQRHLKVKSIFQWN